MVNQFRPVEFRSDQGRLFAGSEGMNSDRFSVSKKLEDNLAVLEAELGYGVTFDLVFRRFKVAHKQSCSVFLTALSTMKR